MKKKIVTVLLAVSMCCLAAGCGDKKETKKEETKTEQAAQEEFVLTNAEGKVVAVDEKNMEKYVSLGEYKNLEVSVEPKEEITDEKVEESIRNQLLYQYDKVEVTEDRAVQEGDTANIDFTGYLDGKEFEGGAGENFDLAIGSGQFIAGFEEGLIGHKKGEEVTLDLTFPEDYMQEDLKGKQVQFKVKINKILQAAELTDEWTAANTDYKTVEEFKAAEKESLQKQEDSTYEGQVKSDLFTLVIDSTEIKDYPSEVLKNAKKKVRKQLNDMYIAQSGITLEEYMKKQNISEEDADKIITESAQTYLKQNLVVQAILDAEGIELTEEDYQKEKEKFAKLSGFPGAADMEKLYSDQTVIKDSVLWNRVCDVIMETAVIKEAEKGADTEAAGQE